jgi:hypothetical protein
MALQQQERAIAIAKGKNDKIYLNGYVETLHKMRADEPTWNVNNQ